MSLLDRIAESTGISTPSAGGMQPGGNTGEGMRGPGYMVPNTRFNALYDRISAINQDAAYRRQQENEKVDDRHSMFDSEGNKKEREMNPLEGFMAGLSRFSEGAMESAGFKPDQDKNFIQGAGENPIGFAGSLVAGMTAGPIGGIPKMFEGLTHTPVTEGEANNKIPDYELDDSQAAASLIDGGIDTVGALFGGSGRVLGTAAKAISGGRIGKSMASGWIRQAMDNAPGYVKNTAQLAGDVAEEAGEEFVQSFADDARNKRLDEGSLWRAANAAGYGALGGGLMSGGGMIANEVVDRRLGNNAQPLQAQSQSPTGKWTSYDQNAFTELLDTKYDDLTSTAKDVFKEYETGPMRERPASSWVRHTRGDGSMGLDDIDYGVHDFKGMFEMSKNNADYLSGVLKSNTKEVADALYNNRFDGVTYTTTEGAMNALKDKRVGNQDIWLAVGRDPDTKNGAFKVRLRNFHSGHYMALSPMVYSVVGSDVDGDTSGVFWDLTDRKTGKPYINTLGRASEMLMDAEGGSNVDWDSAGIGKGKLDKDVYDGFKQSLDDVVAKYNLDQGQAQGTKSFIEQFDEAYKTSKKDGRDVKLSNTFNNLRTAIINSGASKDEAADAVDHVLGKLFEGTHNLIQESTVEAVNQFKRNYEELNLTDKEAKDQKDLLKKIGTTGDANTVAQIIPLINGIAYNVSDKGNPIFRQYGMLKYMVMGQGAFSDSVSQLSSIADRESIFKALIRASFRMAQTAQDPITSVNGMIEAMILSDTLYESGVISNPVRTASDFKNLLEVYRKNHNKYSDIYNDIIKSTTSDGEKITYGWIERPLLSKKVDVTKDEDVLMKFSTTFANAPVEHWLDIGRLPNEEKYRGVALDKMLNEMTLFNGKFDAVFAPMGNDVQKIFSAMERAHFRKKKQVSGRIRRIVENMNLQSVTRRMENGKFDDRDFQYMAAIVDEYQNIIGPRNAVLSGIMDPKYIVGTKIGNMLFSTNEQQRLSAIVAVSMHAQFDSIINDLKSGKTHDVQSAQERLAAMQYVSTVHAYISGELLNSFERDGEPVSYLLNMICNLDMTFDQKEHEYDAFDFVGERDDFLVDCLTTREYEFDEGGVSQRVRTMESAEATAKKLLYDDVITEVQQARERLRDEKSELHFRDYVERMARDMYFEFNNDYAGVLVYDAMTVANPNVEKATIVDSAVHYYSSIAMSRPGGLCSFMDAVLGFHNGFVTMETFSSNRYLLMKCLTDPDFKIEVEDTSTGKHRTMTQQTLFAAYKIDLKGSRPTSQQYLAMLEKVPQMAGWLCEQSTLASEVEGNPNTVRGRKNRLLGSFESWRKSFATARSGDVDPTEKWEIEREINNVKNDLLNRSWFMQYIIYCIRDIDGIAGNPKAISREVSRLIDEAAQAFTYVGHIAPDTSDFVNEYNDFIDSYQGRIRSDLVDTLTNIDGEFKAIFDKRARGSMDLVFRELTSVVKSAAFIDVVNSRLEAIGENLDPVSKGEMKEDVTDKSIKAVRKILMGEDELVEKIIKENLEEIGRHLSIAIGVLSERPENITNAQADPDIKTRVLGDIQELRKEHQEAADNAKKDKKTEEENIVEEIDRLIDDINKDRIYGDPIAEYIQNADMSNLKLVPSDWNKLKDFRKKLNGILKVIGEPQLNEEEAKKIWEDTIDERREYSGQMLEAVVRHEIEQINKKTGGRKNANMFTSSRTIANGIREALKEVSASDGKKTLRQNMQERGTDWGNISRLDKAYTKYGFNKQLPIPNFANETAEYTASAARIMLGSAGSPLAVSLNGGYAKKIMGLGFLPESHLDRRIPDPNPITVEKFLSSYDADIESAENEEPVVEMSRWNVQLPGTNDIVPAETIIDNVRNMNPDDEIIVYDPNLNPHGIDTRFTTQPYTQYERAYHRLSGILARIVDFSQESMVLKAKKKFASKYEVVYDEEFGNTTIQGEVEDQSIFKDMNRACAAMRDQFMGFRDLWMRDLEREFLDGGRMDSLGFGVDQARIVVQGLTPGLKITLKNGEERLIDASLLVESSLVDQNNDAALWAEIQKITDNGNIDVAKVEVLCVSPESAASRVGRAATSKFREGSNPDTDEVRKAAAEAMSDWSNYQFNTLSVQEIMRHVLPLGRGFANPIAVSDSATAMQRLIDEVNESPAGGMFHERWAYRKEKMPKMNKKEFDACEQNTKLLFNKGRDSNVKLVASNEPSNGLYMTAAFYDETQLKNEIDQFAKSNGMADYNDFNAMVSAMESAKKNAVAGKPKIIDNYGFGYVYHESQLAKALEWAIKTNQKLVLANEEIATSNILSDYSPSEMQVTLLANSDGSGSDGEGFGILINPSHHFQGSQNFLHTPTSKERPLDRDSISSVLADETGMWGVADADILATSKGQRFKKRVNDAISFDLTKLIPSGKKSNKPFNALTREQVKNIADDLIDNNGDIINDKTWDSMFDFSSYSNVRDYSKQAIQRRVASYLMSAKKNAIGNDGFDHAGAAGESCVMLVECDGVIAPVILPKKAGSNVTFIEWDLAGNNLTIGYTGEFKLDKKQQVAIKLGLYGFAFKGIVSAMPDGMYEPQVVFPNEQETFTVDFIQSRDSEESRLPGREREVIKNDMWYFMRKMGGVGKGLKAFSAFFDVDANMETAKWKDEIAQNVENSEGVGSENVSSVLASLRENGEAWDRVASGNIRLFNDEKKNRMMQDIAFLCRKYDIDPISLMSTFTYDDTGVKNITRDVDFAMVIGDFDRDQTFRFFNMIDDRLCTDGIKLSEENGKYFNHKGQMPIVSPTGGIGWGYVHWGPHDFTGYESDAYGGAPGKKWSPQHMYRRGADLGYLDAEMRHAVEYHEFMMGNVDYIDLRTKNRLRAAEEDPGWVRQILDEQHMSALVNSDVAASWKERVYQRQLNNVGATYTHPRKVVEHKDSGERVKKPSKDPRIVEAMTDLSELSNGRFNYTMASIVAMFQSGYTFNEGSGESSVPITALRSDIRTIAENIREHGLPVMVPEGGRSQNDRYAIPLLPPDVCDWFWNTMPEIRAKNGNDKQKFIKRMKEEQDKAEKAIADIDVGYDFSRKRALELACDWARKQWGETTSFTRLIGSHYLDEQILMSRRLGGAMRGLAEFDSDEYTRLCEEQEKKIAANRRRVEKNFRKRRVPVPWMVGGQAVSTRTSDDSGIIRVLDNMVSVTQGLALANPILTVSNLTDRFVHQTAMDWGMRIGHRINLGPYTGEHWLRQDIVDRAVNDKLFQKLYIAFREAEFTGQELTFLANVNSVKDIEQWLDARSENRSKPKKAMDLLFRWGAGGNAAIKGQMRNFINRFVMMAEAEGQNFWFDDAGGGLCRLEADLASDGGAGRWFMDVLGAANARTPSYTIALRSMNWAKRGDLAQRTLPSLIVGDLIQRIPISKFVITSTFMKFPNFTFNITGRMLQWVLPMSSINYVVTRMVANTEYGKSIDAESVLDYTSLREAIMVDLAHFGAGVVCMILSNAVQPPDDDDKKGVVGEWLIGGMRIGENWWIQDILGMALPLAEFYHTCFEGKPRFDLLFNGLGEVCSSNPLLGIGTVVDFITDPEGAILSGYGNEVEQFKDAPGGAPTFDQYRNSILANGAMSWLAQFFTPSIAKDIYRHLPEYEKSYKKVYKKGEPHTEGNLERVDYEEAQRRKLTRYNPMLAILADIVWHPDTGYLSTEMPDNIYYDDAQLESSEYWSINGLDDVKKQVKAIEIITLLQQYDNMDELQKTGFYLDTETKALVSQTIWDIYHEYDEWYYSMQSNGQLDFYVLGDGNWSRGQQVAADIKLAWKEGKRYWNDFYYQKIKNSYLSDPMQMYRRYNTTYARDVNGKPYATGYNNYGIAAAALPVRLAPGSATSKDGTAGYDEDFMSVSAVTGNAMDQRALRPLKSENSDWPSLEDWSDDKNGNSYSTNYQNMYGANGVLSDSGYPFGNSTRRSSGGGYGYYGGGGRGGGGGGGGSYSPNLYSRVNMPRTPSTKTYTGDRIQRSDLDYLRPSFETKGSREAYRREDI